LESNVYSPNYTKVILIQLLFTGHHPLLPLPGHHPPWEVIRLGRVEQVHARQREGTALMIFASSLSGTWGNSDPEGITPWEATPPDDDSES
jgi:hypothetical protein